MPPRRHKRRYVASQSPKTCAHNGRLDHMMWSMDRKRAYAVCMACESRIVLTPKQMERYRANMEESAR